MLKNHTATTQALLGTLFTWALTAAGAALVIVIRGKQVSIVVVYSSRTIADARKQTSLHILSRQTRLLRSVTDLTSFADPHCKCTSCTVLRVLPVALSAPFALSPFFSPNLCDS